MAYGDMVTSAILERVLLQGDFKEEYTGKRDCWTIHAEAASVGDTPWHGPTLVALGEVSHLKGWRVCPRLDYLNPPSLVSVLLLQEGGCDVFGYAVVNRFPPSTLCPDMVARERRMITPGFVC